MGAQTFKQLFNYVRQVMKAIFKCESSNIYIHHREIRDAFHKEKGLSVSFRVDNGIHDIFQ